MRDDCSRVYVQDGEKSLEPLTKIDLNFKVKISFFFFFFVLRSTRHEDKTLPRNHKSQSDSSLEKWRESFLIVYARSNSDFIVGRLWMSILHNVYILNNVKMII